MQLSIGKMIKINKFENRFPKPDICFKTNTGFPVFDYHPYRAMTFLNTRLLIFNIW